MTAPSFFFRTPRFRFRLMAFALTGAAFVGGRYWHNRTGHTPAPPATQVAQAGFVTTSPVSVAFAPGKADGAKSREKSRLAVAATFAQVQSLVQSEYVDPLPSDATLAHGATQAMLAALEDEQSRFLLPSERTVLEREKAGNFAGIGAVTAVRGEKQAAGYTELHLLVVAPLPGSPAQKAGLRTGDRITHIDGRYILSGNPYLTPSKMPPPKPDPDAEDGNPKRGGIGLLVAQRMLRQGTTGAQVLTIERRGTREPLHLSVGSAAVAAAPLRVGRVGAAVVLGMGAFTANMQTDLNNALRAAPGASVVVDLRQNPGIGSFEAARAVAARLASGRNFAVEVGIGGKRTPLPMPPGTTFPPRKIAVLVDSGTAGLAEAVAACLVDNGATLVGTARTWGDGRSSTLYPLADGSGYTLTTGRLVGVAGGWDKTGLAPRLLLAKGLSETETLTRAVHAATVGTAVAKEAK